MLLLTGVGGSVNAQADTPTGAPQFATATPGATASPGAGLGGNAVNFSFKGSQAGFAVIEGSWVSGAGFRNTGASVTAFGAYFIESVTKIIIYFDATTAGTMEVELQDSMANVEYSASGGYSSGLNNSVFFSPASVNAQTLVFSFDPGAGMVTVTGVRLEYSGISESYDVGDNGCPVLSPEQIAKLDAQYYAQCSRCFTTPTPVRGNQIPTQVLAFPTADLTSTSPYNIPLIISGTPVTLTPGLIGGLTATPTHTPTPTGTWIPTYLWFFTFAGDDPLPYTISAGSQGIGEIVSESAFNSGAGNYDVYAGVRIDTSSIGDLKAITVRGRWDTPQIGLKFQYWYPSDNPSAAQYHFQGNAVDTYRFDGLTVESYSGHVLEIGVAGNSTENGYHTYIEEITLESSESAPATATPLPTATGAAWLSTPDNGVYSCEVAVFRDDTPAVMLPDRLNVYSYDCYTLIPDVTITIPGRGDLQMDGTELCVTWFEMPVVQVLGITVSIDWLLVGLIMWIVTRLLSF